MPGRGFRVRDLDIQGVSRGCLDIVDATGRCINDCLEVVRPSFKTQGPGATWTPTGLKQPVAELFFTRYEGEACVELGLEAIRIALIT